MRIYSKTGDDGTTGLIGGTRTTKNDARVIAVGEIDELNSAIGLVRVHTRDDPLDELPAMIQNWLFDIGAELACPPEGKYRITRIGAKHCEILERSIDDLSAKLPELASFILPGGCPLAASLHWARAVCRRAERAVVALHQAEPVRDEVREFLNRLSDWLFTAARTANKARNVNDIVWTQSEEL